MLPPKQTLPTKIEDRIHDIAYKISVAMGETLTSYDALIKETAKKGNGAKDVANIWSASLVYFLCNYSKNMKANFGPITGWSEQEFLEGVYIGAKHSLKEHSKPEKNNKTH